MAQKTLSSLAIIDISGEGQGVARTEEGQVVFVPYTVPGDVVDVEVVKSKKRHAKAVVSSVVEASSDRNEPGCSYFETCGGCDWQHIAKDRQVYWKSEIIGQAIRRIGNVEWEQPIDVHSPVDGYGVRSRLRAQVGRNNVLGFFHRGSRRLIRVSRCPVALPCLNDAWEWLQNNLVDFPFALAEVRLLGNKAGEVIGSFHFKPNVSVSQRKLGKDLTAWWRRAQGQGFPMLGVEIFQTDQLLQEFGKTLIEEGEWPVLYRASGFAQASWAGNERLIREVLRLWDLDEPVHILELYAGCGNLSIPLASQGSHVWALDLDLRALRDGAYSARKHNLQQRLQFEKFDDQQNSLPAFCQERNISIDWLVVDPPRRGIASRVREEILGLKPPTILYVSCDPSTLARDIQFFAEGGYSLKELSGVDLMPQTSHVECVALLRHEESF